MPYEEFLQQFGLLLRSSDPSISGCHGNQLPSNGCENKENEPFDDLDVLYQKQLNMTPKQQSKRRKLRRRAGSYHNVAFRCDRYDVSYYVDVKSPLNHCSLNVE